MIGKFVLSAIVLGVGVAIVALGAGLGWGLFPQIVEDDIVNNVVLKNGSEAWKNWQNTSTPLQFKFYMFSVDNPYAILNGKTPIVLEKGPYVYDAWNWKDNIELNENGTNVSYYRGFRLVFNQELSGTLSEKDKIIVLNPALMGSILALDMQYPITNGSTDSLKEIQKILQHVLELPNDHDTGPFTQHNVDELLFKGIKLNCDGLKAPKGTKRFCKNLGEMIDEGSKVLRRECQPEKYPCLASESTGNYLYSYFYMKNATHDGRYTINTGVKESNKLGLIEQWQNKTTLNMWTGSACNQIYGTDATIFPPFLTKDTRIDIFTTDLCRSLYAKYESDIEYKGIPGYRYVADEKQLASVLDESKNYCWSGPFSGGTVSGLLDLYPCYDVPVVFTFPHFYQASKVLNGTIGGLNPVKETHETFFELEPFSGMPLRRSKRVQWNMLIKEVEYVYLTTGIKPALLPLFWVEESEEMSSSSVERLQTDVLDPINALEITRWTLIGVGTATTLIGCGLLLSFWLIV